MASLYLKFDASGQLHGLTTLPHKKGPPVCTEEEVCWACQSGHSGREKNVAPARNHTTDPLQSSS